MGHHILNVIFQYYNFHDKVKINSKYGKKNLRQNILIETIYA